MSTVADLTRHKRVDTVGGAETTTKGQTSERAQDRNAHLSKRALADDLDRPEISQTDLCPTEPQKLRLRAHMPPDFTQPAVLRHARERSLELGTSKQAQRGPSPSRRTETRRHRHIRASRINPSASQIDGGRVHAQTQ